MKADLRSRRDFGEIIRAAYSVYAANFRLLLLIALITLPLRMLTIVLDRRVDSEGAQFAVSLLQFPAALVSLIAAGALIHSLNRIADGTQTEIGEALDAGFARFPAVLTSYLLVIGLVLSSLVAFPFLGIWWLVRREATIDGRRDWWLVLPMVLPIYLALRWTFFLQAAAIESRRNWAALDASADVVRGSWWRAFGVLLGAGLVTVGPVLLAQTATFGPVWIEALGVPLVAALFLPFSIAAHTLLYYDLKARNADADADRFAAAEPDVPREGA